MLMKLWKFCCSLKLTIVTASLATFLLMGGSLLFPGNPQLFDSLDRMPLGAWLSGYASAAPGLSWWFFAFAVALGVLIINTGCCFIDWLLQIRSRWRKSGEYLIHLGTILLFIGFCWGAAGGWRHIALPCTVGELTPLPNWPGHYLRVDAFKPEMADNGRPLDMISQVSIYRGDNLLVAGEVRINQPLLHAGLVVTPASFGQQPVGFYFLVKGRKQLLKQGVNLGLGAGQSLEILRFLGDARYDAQGRLQYRNDRIGNPALELRITSPQGEIWRGWYFLTQAPPAGLRALNLRPLSPAYASYSSLTINFDPGARLSALGAILVACGCCFALISFYRKRRLGDRPEVC